MGPAEIQLLLDRISSAEAAVNRRIDDYTHTTNAQLLALDTRHGQQYQDLNDALGKIQTDVTAMRAADTALKEEAGTPVRFRHLTLFTGGAIALDWMGHYLRSLMK